MKLKRLRLHGFKSFADRTDIDFHDGMTAIVGPNGCGKSNISDAVRWVLGEQRPTAIRGAKMEEAIFQGTVNRRPVNRGSVTMEISNESGALPVPFGEVEISRTVYRDGGSDYQLNRSACRLRDIQDLCRDTGLGANAYAVIENRMIDAILSDRADERRSLFEEASGIGKYKDRRKAALRKLERTENDLQRLDDVIGEVESKVRSLARQKGKAERYGELRRRRLDVEMTVVRRELATLEERLQTIRQGLEGGAEEERSLEARISTTEARVESLRVEQVEGEKERTRAAARVDEIRSELVRWERELAVAEERGGYARRRLEQLEGERAEARTRRERSDVERVELAQVEGARSRELVELRERVESHRQEADGVRARVMAARETLQEVEGREREVARRAAQLQGDAESAGDQASELAVRIRRIDEELEDARTSLEEVRSQGDLFTDQLQGLEAAVTERRSEVESLKESLEKLRSAHEAAREAEREAQDRAGALQTRLRTLERMERDREGMDPVLKDLLTDPPDGVLGVLADGLSAEPEVMAAVEAYLGVTSRGVLVRDERAAGAVTRWFREEWDGGGGLVVLPVDRAPEVAGRGTLLERLELRGPGAAWVRALLDGVEFSEDGEGLDTDPAVDRVGADGVTRTRDGMIRVGNPLGATGLLERQGELRGLGTEAEEARLAAEAAQRARHQAQQQVREGEIALEAARQQLREAEDALREGRSREEERTRHRRRMEQILDDLVQRREAAVKGRDRASDRAEGAQRERAALVQEEEDLRGQRARARQAMEAVQEEWEEVRTRLSELTVREARLEGEVERIAERRAALLQTAEAAASRLDELEREEGQLEDELTRVAELKAEGQGETRRLFQLRDEAQERLRECDSELQSLQEQLTEAERRAREARSAERQASEARHRLELEAQELDGRIGRIRDRLEGEWGRSLDVLMDDARELSGEPEELRAELREIVEKLERMGPVNMLAVEEHEEESTRLVFLREQRDDLVEARDDLRSAIREINQTATRLFSETLDAIRENFRATFVRLFQGGECDLWLEDPDDPLESDIEIHASPRGKRTQRIELLSGGERALTALSLLFGIYLVKPSPFCVLDEVDAPLDESNIGRFIRLLQEFKDQTQFIVITHNPRTIEAADWIYGVTMEEPGVSSIVGVRLEDALETAGV
jgi:chromosome segregation protein